MQLLGLGTLSAEQKKWRKKEKVYTKGYQHPNDTKRGQHAMREGEGESAKREERE